MVSYRLVLGIIVGIVFSFFTVYFFKMVDIIPWGISITWWISKLIKKTSLQDWKIACFTSIDALKIREEKISEENLIKISKYYLYDHNEYRNLDSYLFSELDGILREELKDANLIIDITPLTKLFSLILLKKSNEYDLPCFYIGKENKGNNKLIWMSNIKIEGELK